MRKSSYHKEQVFHRLISELNERNTANQAQPNASKWIRLFCMYLANYTTIKHIGQIDRGCVQEYFSYLITNHKRLSLNLKDIKKATQTIETLLNLRVNNTVSDFSLSNINLWSNLK